MSTSKTLGAAATGAAVTMGVTYAFETPPWLAEMLTRLGTELSLESLIMFVVSVALALTLWQQLRFSVYESRTQFQKQIDAQAESTRATIEQNSAIGNIVVALQDFRDELVSVSRDHRSEAATIKQIIDRIEIKLDHARLMQNTKGGSGESA